MAAIAWTTNTFHIIEKLVSNLILYVMQFWKLVIFTIYSLFVLYIHSMYIQYIAIHSQINVLLLIKNFVSYQFDENNKIFKLPVIIIMKCYQMYNRWGIMHQTSTVCLTTCNNWKDTIVAIVGNISDFSFHP